MGSVGWLAPAPSVYLGGQLHQANQLSIDGEVLAILVVYFQDWETQANARYQSRNNKAVKSTILLSSQTERQQT